MTSLRERLEQKARRTALLPVLVGDASGTAKAVTDAILAVQEHQRTVDGEPTQEQQATEQQLRERVAAALEAQRGTVVYVELQALDPAEWDAVFGDVEPDDDGTIPLDDYRAALLAASCTDPDLQDADWWEQQLSRPEWSKGDRINAVNTLIALNLNVPAGPPGKG